MKICFIGNGTSVHEKKWFDFFSNHHRLFILTEVEVFNENVSVINFRTTEPFKSPALNFLIKNLLGSIFIITDKMADWKILNRAAGDTPKYLLNALKCKRIIEDIKPDLVCINFLWPYGFFSLLVKKVPKICFIFGSDILIQPKKSWLHSHFTKLVLYQFTKVFGPGIDLLNVAKNEYGLAKNKISVNSIVGIKAEEINTKREGSEIVFSCRSFEPLYNVELLIKAVPQVLKIKPEIKFILAGDGSLRNQLEAMVRKFEVDDNVEFLGIISNQEILNYMGNSSVYVSTSKSDSFHVSLLEALAAGCFPVVTNIWANRNLIIDGYNGFLVPINDPGILANRIIEALMNKPVDQKVINYNRELIREKGNLENNLSRVEIEMEELLNNSLSQL